jgi:hypothetical protein
VGFVDSLVEAIKFFGGLGGLASAGFLIYDRVFRGAPAVFLVPQDYKTCVRFVNVSSETLVIDEVDIEPAVLQMVRANDLATVNEERNATFYGTPEDERLTGIYIVLRPEQERTFPLHRFADFETSDRSRKVTIRCRWANTRKPLPISRYVRIKTTVGAVEKLREASLAGKV